MVTTPKNELSRMYACQIHVQRQCTSIRSKYETQGIKTAPKPKMIPESLLMLLLTKVEDESPQINQNIDRTPLMRFTEPEIPQWNY